MYGSNEVVEAIYKFKCVIFLHLKTQGKKLQRRGKHSEFHFNLSVATLMTTYLGKLAICMIFSAHKLMDTQYPQNFQHQVVWHIIFFADYKMYIRSLQGGVHRGLILDSSN